LPGLQSETLSQNQKKKEEERLKKTQPLFFSFKQKA
jgi:hypothetical protein